MISATNANEPRTMPRITVPLGLCSFDIDTSGGGSCVVLAGLGVMGALGEDVTEGLEVSPFVFNGAFRPP